MFGSGKDKASPLAASTANGAAGKQIDTLIAQQCTLEGDLTTQNSIKVDGQIKGTLRAEGRAIIGETGVVKGDVHAVDLLVLGRLEGNVPSGCTSRPARRSTATSRPRRCRSAPARATRAA